MTPERKRFAGFFVRFGLFVALALVFVVVTVLVIDFVAIDMAERVVGFLERFEGWQADELLLGVLLGVLLAVVGLAIFSWRQRRQSRSGLAQRKAVAEGLRVSEEKYRTLVETTATGYVILDAEGRVLDANPEYVRLTGHAALEEIRHRQVTEWTAPHDLARNAEEVQKCAEVGHTRNLVIDYVDRQGRFTPIEINATVLPTPEGATIVTLCRDITERNRAEEALRRSEEQYRGIFEGSADAFLVFDMNGVIVEVSPAARAMYGYTREEMIGLSGKDIVHPDYYHGFGELKRQIKAQGLFCGESVDLRKDGTTFDAEVRVALFDYRGSPHFLVVVRDVTARKRAEEALARRTEELARSNAELEQFAYVASHDLQEPLRMVTGYVQLLARRYKGKLDSDADEFIDFAVDGAARMQALINDVLAYSRVHLRGKAFEPTDCEALLGRTLSDLERALEESGAAVTHDSLPTVMADERQLGRVFQNLIANAIKFRDEKPLRVHVWAEQEASQWRFAVRDNGIGIDPQYQERVFAIFQRLHGRSEYPGTGVGLAICNKIVQRHGGRIWVESEPGNGSTFYFTIPQREVRTDDNSSDHAAEEVCANAGQTGGDTPG